MRYTAGTELRPILVRNKDLLARALETLPVAGRTHEAVRLPPHPRAMGLGGVLGPAGA